jgi:hypothetical protein
VRAGPVVRWAATVLVWAVAPIAGLAILNLPTLVTMQTHDASAGLYGEIAAGLFVGLVLWVAAAFALARLHRGAARRTHIALTAILALAGLAWPDIYGLYGYLTYRTA